MHTNRNLLYIMVFFLLGLGLVACSGDRDSGTVSQSVVQVNPLAPESDLTEEIRSAPVTVQEAYRFALSNPDILTQVPCYCGCGSVGHKSNYECYVSGFGAEGKPVFDAHALG